MKVQCQITGVLWLLFGAIFKADCASTKKVYFSVFGHRRSCSTFSCVRLILHSLKTEIKLSGRWENIPLNGKHMVLHPPSPEYFFCCCCFNFFSLYPFPSMRIHPVCQPAGALRGLPTRYPCQPPPALPCYQPAAGVERPDWRAHSACPVIASVYHQPEDFYYCRWMIGLASCRPGKASSF